MVSTSYATLVGTSHRIRNHKIKTNQRLIHESNNILVLWSTLLCDACLDDTSKLKMDILHHMRVAGLGSTITSQHGHWTGPLPNAVAKYALGSFFTKLAIFLNY